MYKYTDVWCTENCLEHRRGSGGMWKVSRIQVMKEHELRQITCQEAGRNLTLEG